MNKQLEQVKKFMETFEQEVASNPTIPNLSIIHLRTALAIEEVMETDQAAVRGDLVGVADGLGDQLYILLGTFLAYGFHEKAVRIFDEIQRSNMSKANPDGSVTKSATGKVIKSPTYSPADLAPIVLEN